MYISEYKNLDEFELQASMLVSKISNLQTGLRWQSKVIQGVRSIIQEMLFLAALKTSRCVIHTS